MEKENKRLREENATLNAAFKKSEKFIGDSLKEVSLEDCIEGAKKNKTLKQIKKDNECPKCKDVVKKIPTRAGHVLICGNNKCKYKVVNGKT